MIIVKKLISRIVDKKLAKCGWEKFREDDYLVQFTRPLAEMKPPNGGIVEVVDLFASGNLTSHTYDDIRNYDICAIIRINELFLFAVKLWCIGRKTEKH